MEYCTIYCKLIIRTDHYYLFVFIFDQNNVPSLLQYICSLMTCLLAFTHVRSHHSNNHLQVPPYIYS